MSKEFKGEQKGFNPFGELIGLRYTGFDNESSQITLPVEKRLFNPHKVLHGGVIYSLADTGMGMALYPYLEDDELCTTVEIKIGYFGSVRTGLLTCDSRVINKGRKIASMESEISNDKTLIAKASGTFYIYKNKNG